MSQLELKHEKLFIRNFSNLTLAIFNVVLQTENSLTKTYGKTRRY